MHWIIAYLYEASLPMIGNVCCQFGCVAQQTHCGTEHQRLKGAESIVTQQTGPKKE